MRASGFRFQLAIGALFVLGFAMHAIAADQPSPSALPSPAPAKMAPQAIKVMISACKALSAEPAFSFHAEILFDQVLPGDVKVQFGGAMDYAVERPDKMAIKFQSDLGAKDFWFNSGTMTLVDPPHSVYATETIAPSLDEMLVKVAQLKNLTIPLSDFAASDPCALLHRVAQSGGYVGIGDVNRVTCDHVAFSTATTDFQLWIDRSGKPIPRKVVINYRSVPGSPEYIAVLSNWKFPKSFPDALFQTEIPKKAIRIDFVKVKEARP